MTAPKDPATRYKRRPRANARDLPDVLNSEELASLFGCGVNKVRELVRSGELPALPFGGNHIRVAKSAALRYLRGQR